MEEPGQTDATLFLQRFLLTFRFLSQGAIAENWGPTLRGGFGLALRRTCCPFGREDCQGCSLGLRCAYAYLFETPIFADTAIMRKYREAPHPFVFEPPPPGTKHVKAGDTAVVGLVLVGKAVDMLPYIYVALDELGRHGLGRDRVPFQLERITTEQGHPVWDRSQSRRFSIPDYIRLNLDPGPDRQAVFTLEFQSPTRVVVQGKLTKSPELIDIVKTLVRRVFLLRYFHCGGCIEPLSTAFLEAAASARLIRSELSWQDWERFSGRQKRRIPIGGLVGRVVFQGDLGRLRPLLAAGEFVHVGKNTTFGLGKFRIYEGEGS
ncbi:MAG: CRISPR system precrRNA processing endoribonuclease RAMP protein Cas6 [Thermoguttaceae bacterium]|nr:CRISPR system precrRNA processing endoribonuclease RAMP protein Cas6 [Thermoguttaceae bacterium]MDW8080167.1 CRISPR system precrRNA processing endoribonuclease RAMP protein Cas6 [Thermoguttaceae bacterium]